ncbi:MAG: RNA methyltransferase [Rhodothermales bacterium]
MTQRRRKEIAALAQKKHRERSGHFLVEGVRAVEAAVLADAPLVDLAVTEAAAQTDRVAALLAQLDAPVYRLTPSDFSRLSEVQTAQGILAVVRMDDAPLHTLHQASRILALDGVQDPGNVGTLIRTAAWFGVEAVLAGPGTADVYNPKVVRSAMGSLWDVRLARTTNLATTLHDLNRPSYGADLVGTSVGEWQPATPSVLVMGSEAHGIRTEVQALLSETVVIPGVATRQGTESLNVAVAGGILMQAWAQ